jgi:hypothetical protein
MRNLSLLKRHYEQQPMAKALSPVHQAGGRLKNELSGLNRVYDSRDDAVSTWLVLGRTTGQP